MKRGLAALESRVASLRLATSPESVEFAYRVDSHYKFFAGKIYETRLCRSKKLCLPWNQQLATNNAQPTRYI